MSTFFAITFSGLALGALYFVVASGLSLIYGLMEVLNFAHGAFLTLGAYSGWAVSAYLPSAVGGWWRFAVAGACAVLGGLAAAVVSELVFVRPLYGRPVSQILVTVGLDLMVVALLLGAFSSNSETVTMPLWLYETTRVGGASLPNGDFLVLGGGVAVLTGIGLLLHRTRYGIVIRAGAENREMVRALGIDVGRAFTVVFALGGAAAGLAGFLNSVAFSGALVDPTQGDTLLIFAFIVVVIGGLGSIAGSAVAAVLVGLMQDYVGFYVGSRPGLAQIGNISVVLLLALVLEIRPRGLLGRRDFA